MYMDDTFMCMDKSEWMRLMCIDGRVEWMRFLCMTVYMYNYLHMCNFSV
jgi:hypothetical protein